MLVIGPSGHGKSWFGSTVPAPRLIIDLEGRARYTPNGRQAVTWDGVSNPMELTRSPSRTYIVTVTSVAVLDSVRQWLRSGRHPFFSIVVDSLMEAQMRSMDDIRPGTAALKTQDWGTLLRAMEQLVRELRDLTITPGTNVHVAVFIAGAKLHDGFIRPLMQGSITSKVPYWMDVVGYLEKVRGEDGAIHRRLWIDQRPENDLEVKDGTDVLLTAYGPCIIDPDAGTMYETLRRPAGNDAAIAAEGGNA